MYGGCSSLVWKNIEFQGNLDMDFLHFLSSLFFLFFLLPFPTSLADEERCHSEDKAILLEFKNSFSNPDPLHTWFPDTDCCDWYGVFCDENTNRVTRLYIYNDAVAGSIPDAVSRLTHLQILRLHKLPNLTGQIPPSISNLSALLSLDISWTNISGPVPPFLASLQNLKFLILSFNNLSGSIPPELARLPNINAIYLSRNRLTGQIPDSFGYFPGSVQSLELSHNQLSGEIPRSLANVDFSRVDISRNFLVGDASVLFNASKTTTMIDISRNMFEFNFSGAGFPRPPGGTFISLDISHNRIFGGIPFQITEAIYLQFLNVSYNRMCGKIPQEWKLKYRRDVFDETSYFHNRCLCGPPLQPCKPSGK